MRTTEKPGEFYIHRRNRSNGMGTFSSRAQQRHGEDAGWTVFVEEHGEQLTPYFVRGSQEVGRVSSVVAVCWHLATLLTFICTQ